MGRQGFGLYAKGPGGRRPRVTSGHASTPPSGMRSGFTRASARYGRRSRLQYDAHCALRCAPCAVLVLQLAVAQGVASDKGAAIEARASSTPDTRVGRRGGAKAKKSLTPRRTRICN